MLQISSLIGLYGNICIMSSVFNIVPHNQVGDVISTQLFRNYNQPWAKWTEIPKDNWNAWFNEFLVSYLFYGY